MASLCKPAARVTGRRRLTSPRCFWRPPCRTNGSRRGWPPTQSCASSTSAPKRLLASAHPHSLRQRANPELPRPAPCCCCCCRCCCCAEPGAVPPNARGPAGSARVRPQGPRPPGLDRTGPGPQHGRRGTPRCAFKPLWEVHVLPFLTAVRLFRRSPWQRRSARCGPSPT